MMRLVCPFERTVARLAFGVLACAVALACGSSEGPAGGAPSAASASDPTDLGAAGAADSEPVPQGLLFSPSKTLKLSPKQSRQLTVTTDPPGRFHVRFALLGSGYDSAPADAVLNTSDVQTGTDGVARVKLTAPSTPTTFSVRASVAGKVPAFLGVSVSSLGYTTLRVMPSYSGHRAVSQWTATARNGAKCSKLGGNPPPDGDLSVSAPAGESLELEAPIGLALTVTLRAGHYIGGCVDEPALVEGDGNQVLVYASDRPLNLEATRLDLKFGPSDERPAFTKLMKSSVTAAEDALVGNSANDVQALLDAMHDATNAASRDAFGLARQAQGWEAALTAAFGRGAVSRLREPTERWLNAGVASFHSPDTFFGQLSDQASGTEFDLTSVAHVPPADAGVPSTFQSSWSADSSDTLLVGSELSWVPSRLVTALAVAPALLEFPTQTSLQGALTQSVDCALVSKTLLAHGTTPGAVVYGSCDAACALATCANAINGLLQRARDASGASVARLSVTAAGAAEVGDTGEVTGLKGSWVGQLDIASDSAAVSGALSATASSN